MEVAAKHELLAPTLLRSQVLSALHEAVHNGKLERDVARDRLTHRADADSPARRRRSAAGERGRSPTRARRGPKTYVAEYIALTQLQGDAFVTLDAKLARRVGKLVETAAIDALLK